MTSHNPAPGQPAAPSDEFLRTCLSGLADGEADGPSSQAACTAWRERADMRRTWHAYQLIGDVLRSEELARPAAHDDAFLARLRGKLADEPVVLAPMPEPAPVASGQRERRRMAWLFPAAAAAGFVAVAGVLVVTRLSGPDVGAAGGLQAGGVVAPPTTVVNTGAGPTLIRDERLDSYLNAHQAARGHGAMAVPGTGLRNADVVMPAGAGR